MQIAAVGLRNLRSYRAAELQLGPGTTLLTGDIGSGKTSLLYAIEMALFGFAEVDPGYLVRHGAKDAEVSLTLTDGTRRWELRRRFVRKARKGRDAFEPTENSLAVDGQRTSYSATELRRWTIDLLGFPDNPNPRAHSDVWRWAVYLAQERMRDVLDPDVEARMETVRKALGVEQYRLAGENARGLTRALGERAASLVEQATRHRGVEEEAGAWQLQRSTAEQELRALEAQEEALRDQLHEARTNLEDLETRRRSVQTAREAISHQERLARELERSVEQDRGALEASRAHLARLEQEFTRESVAAPSGKGESGSLPSLRTSREEAAARLAHLDRLRGEASVISDQLGQAGNRERALQVRVDATLRELSLVQAERLRLDEAEPVADPSAPEDRTGGELLAERNQLDERRRELDRRAATGSVELQELLDIVREGVCPRCHRPVEPSEFEAHQIEQQNLVDGLRDEVEAATRQIQVADQRVGARLEYERQHERWQQLDSRRLESRQRDAALHARSVEEQGVLLQVTTERTDLEARRDAVAGPLEGYERERLELADVDRAIVAAEERARLLSAWHERVTALERQIPEVRGEIGLREKTEAERIARRDEVRRQIAAAQAELQVPTDLEERWTAGRRRFDEVGQSLENTLRDAGRPRGKVAEAVARLEDLTRRQREREDLDRQASQLTRLADWIDKEFRNAMLELERRRLLQGRLQFERRFAQYFAALVEDPSLAARVDETFAPWVDIAGQPTPAEALSGGERTALALAYRLALGRTVRDAGRLALETLILDEPTEGFSQEQTLRMGDLLESLGLPQVLLVSHERQLEGIADRVVRIRKKDGVSTVEDVGRPAETDSTMASLSNASAPAPARSVRRRKIRRLSDLEAVETEGDAPHAR